MVGTRIPRRDLGPGRSVRITVDGDDVAVFQVGEDFFAVANQCPHQHFSRIYQGSLGAQTVTCPMHGWTFDLRTGASTNGNGRLRTYSIEVGETFLIVKREA